MRKLLNTAVLHLLLLLMLSWMNFPVFANDLVILSGQTSKLTLGPHLALYEEQTATQDIMDVSSAESAQLFQKVTKDQLNLGYSNSVFWLRFSVHWTDSSPLLLQLAYPLIDFIDFYLPDDQGGFHLLSAGDRRPLSIQRFPSPDIIFTLPAKPSLTQTYYLRIQSGGSLQLPLQLWSTAEFASDNGEVRYIHGVYYGIMLVMILYNLFLLVFVRDRNYFHYAVYISSYLLLQLSLNGYAQFYLWPDYPWWSNRSVPFFVGLVVFFATNFSRQFLTTQHYLPKTDWLLKAMMAFSFGIMLASLITDYNIIAPISNVAGVLLPLILLPAGYLSLRSGYRPARFYVIAWSMFLLGILITGLMFTGYIPRNLFTSYAMQIGSAMEVVLLSIALADRINILRRGKEAAQREATVTLQRLNEGLEAEVKGRTRELAQHANNLEKTVTERTTDLRRSNEQLSRAVHAKDQFLATMSHELRTPLNGVIGLSEILSMQRHGPLNDKQQSYIGMISDSGHHLLALINDILDVTQIESQSLVLTQEWVEVESICQQSLQMVRPDADNSGQHIIFKQDAKAQYIWADKVRLKQILVNLLGNAVKFTAEGGTIGLDVRAIKSENCIEFSIWDTGCGISQEDQEHLFQPFVQVDNSFSRKHQGTGLGLNLVQRLTELHDGSVNVESEVGQGSRFTVRFSWNKDAQARMEPASPDNSLPTPAILPASTEAITVLLAEDNELNLTTFTDFLSEQGFKVHTARNGVEAIQLAENTNPDIILMDIQMPEMDGLEATRHIRKIPQLSSVPIIALTSQAMKGDKERCLNAGMDSYLSKPILLNLLFKEIMTLLSKSIQPLHSEAMDH